MNIVRWRPNSRLAVRDLVDLQDEMDRLFGLPLYGGDLLSERGSLSPAVDVYEDKDNVVVKADLPGMAAEDIDLQVEDKVLTLKGSRNQEKEVKEGDFYRCERSYGSFQRSFTLPAGVDESKISATFKDGVLKVTLPKAEEAKPKKVKIGIN